MVPRAPVLKSPSSLFWVIGIICAIIILWAIPAFTVSLQKAGAGVGLWGIFTVIALGITAIAPLLYGWQTKDSTGAVIIGFLPLILMMVMFRFVLGNSITGIGYLEQSVLYFMLLSFIGGLSGYFATKGERKYLVASVVCAIVWMGILLGGIR